MAGDRPVREEMEDCETAEHDLEAERPSGEAHGPEQPPREIPPREKYTSRKAQKADAHRASGSPDRYSAQRWPDSGRISANSSPP